jgi:LCP family protein required for cell wall assembly
MSNSLREQSIRRQKMRQTLKWLVLGIGMLGAMFVGTFAGRLYFGNRFAQSVIKTLFSGQNPMAVYTPANQFPSQHIITILLLGCDHDYSEVLPGKPLKGRGRSDAIMVARVDLDNNSINLMSIPRDTAVHIPDKGVRKINAAYGIGGPELTQRTIKEVFGIDTDYYVTIDFEGFQKIVDAVGGVDVVVQKRLKYHDNWGNLHIDLQPGPQHLTGYQAMGYVRMRHSDNDFMRAKRQQAFLESLRTKVKDPKNFMRIPDVLNALAESLSSNMTQDQMLALANFAKGIDRDKIVLNTLPCFEGPSYVYIDTVKSEEMIQKLFPGVFVSIQAPDRGALARADKRRSKRGKGDAADLERLDGGEDIPRSREPRAEKPSGDTQGHKDETGDDTQNTEPDQIDKSVDTPEKTSTNKTEEKKPEPPKPAETKPAETKPTEPKPAEPKPTKPEDNTKEKTP